MKIVLAISLFLASSPVWAASKPNPADYTINVHVMSSHLVPSGDAEGQRLEALINGKKFELEGGPIFNSVMFSKSLHYGILKPGDYKARIVPDDHNKKSYVDEVQYELLFPDGTTQKFTLSGESE